MRRFLVGLLIALSITAFAGSSPTWACSCVPSTDAEAFDRADHVFVGSLTDARSPFFGRLLNSGRINQTRYIFTVERVYKGSVFEVQAVVQPPEGGTCGMAFDLEQPMLVFAQNDMGEYTDPVAGEVATSLCSGNRAFANDPSAALGPGFPPRSGRSPIGIDRTGLLILLGVIAVLGLPTLAMVLRVTRHRRRLQPTGV